MIRSTTSIRVGLLNGEIGIIIYLQLSLKQESDELRTKYGITIEGIRTEIAGCSRPWTAEIVEKQSKLFQKTVARVINDIDRPDPIERIRNNIERWSEGHPDSKVARGWGISTPIGRAAPACLRNLKELKGFLPPRVCASVFRTILNGWCTNSRFGLINDQCPFCLSPLHGFIDHSIMCPKIQNMVLAFFRQNRLYLTHSHVFAFSCTDHSLEKDGIDFIALYVYFVSRAYNYVRHGEVVSSRLVSHIGKLISVHCPHAQCLIRYLKFNQVTLQRLSFLFFELALRRSSVAPYVSVHIFFMEYYLNFVRLVVSVASPAEKGVVAYIPHDSVRDMYIYIYIYRFAYGTLRCL